MAVQYSTAIRNAKANQTETVIGAAPTLEVRTGTPPTNLTDAATGTVLISIVLPADWLTDAVGGLVTKNGTWTTPNASASGVAGWFTINQGATRHMQGTAGGSGSGADMTLNNPTGDVVAGQEATVNTFNLQTGNA